MQKNKFNYLSLIVFLVASLGWSGIIASQTRFMQFNKEIDMKNYDFVEKCLVGVSDIIYKESVKSGLYKDTLQFNATELYEPLANPVVAFAKECSLNWREMPNVSLEKDSSFFNIAKLFLYANRDDEIREVIHEIVQTRAKVADSIFMGAFYNTFRLVVLTRPIRIDILDTLTNELVKRRKRMLQIDQSISYQGYLQQILRFYIGLDKQDMALKVANEMLDINGSLSEEDKAEIGWFNKGGHIMVFQALKYINHKALLDSLSKSTDAYLSLYNSMVDASTGGRRNMFRSIIGSKIKTPDYSFYSRSLNNHDTSYVDKIGHEVSFVLFLGHNCYYPKHGKLPEWRGSGHARPCYDSYAAIKRINNEFISVPIVVSAQTRGYFGPFALTDPQDEAKLMSKLWIDFHKLPADLAVENTEHWFLPGYDKRRIDNLTVNQKNYSPDGNRRIPEKTIVLIDSDGIIIDADDLDRFNERKWKEMLRAIANRRD